MKRIMGANLLVRMPEMMEYLTDSGLFIPECANEPPVEAVVLGVGGSVKQDIQIGDRVVFGQWAGIEYEDGRWGKVLIVEEKDLEAVIEVKERAHATL